MIQKENTKFRKMFIVADLVSLNVVNEQSQVVLNQIEEIMILAHQTVIPVVLPM